MRQDPRAVENPISAMFDLSEDVVREAGTIKKAVGYATIFMGIWLCINFLLFVIFFFNGNLLLFLVTLALFVVGVMALQMFWSTKKFFKYYVARHASIKAVRDADPLVYAPKASSPSERLLIHLRATTPQLGETGVEVAMPGIVQGGNGLQYKFDIYAKKEASGGWRALGIGDPGFAIFVKLFEARPKSEDIISFKNAVEAVSMRTKIQPLRAIVLWMNGEGGILDEATYNVVMSNQIQFSQGMHGYSCAIEVISERPNGEYDFIPFMARGR